MREKDKQGEKDNQPEKNQNRNNNKNKTKNICKLLGVLHSPADQVPGCHLP
jgi:hypothetical protein